MTGHVHGGAASGLLSLAVCLGVAYELLAVSGAGRGRPWPAWRGAAFLGGCAVLAVAVAAPAMTFTGHMTRHLLVGMVAPLGLVLGAPVTLLLRSMPAAQARQVSRTLRTRPVRLLTHPVIALALTTGSLASLLLTPLYARLSAGPATHALMEWHFLLAGALFVWSVAGPDPAPHRPSVRYRLVVLGAAIAAHATLAQARLRRGVGHDPGVGRGPAGRRDGHVLRR